MTTKFNVGDLLEVVRNDGKKFKCLVVENYDGGFVGKVLSKDKGVGTATWTRYDLKDDSRFQSLSECKTVKVLAKSVCTQGSSTLTLNESMSGDNSESTDKSDLSYYETPIDNKTKAVFCVCEGFGGWSFCSNDSRPNALKESFFNSQISKLKTCSKASSVATA